ncbi:hypothetical protein Tco_0790141 [Tanacetum coccineum]
MLLNFSDDFKDTDDEIIEVNKKKEKGKATVGDEDLKHRMPTNAKIYDRIGDPKDHACAKDTKEISKIIRIANETLPNFKERWVSESNAIPNVPELMQILSFMSSHKCPELPKRFSDSIPKTVDKMLKRVDDYVRSKEAFRNTELPKDAKWHTEREKSMMVDEKWMNVPIMFPPILARDLSKEALIVEAEVERWTEDAEIALQELKKTILNLPSLITLIPKEKLYVYLAASQEAVGNEYSRKGQKAKPNRQNRAREQKERKEKSKSKPSQKFKVNKIKSKSTPGSGFGKSIKNQTRKPKLPKVGPPVPT